MHGSFFWGDILSLSARFQKFKNKTLFDASSQYLSSICSTKINSAFKSLAIFNTP